MDVLIRPWPQIIFFLWLLISAVSPAFAANTLQLHEQDIKAGLLYNFLKYTQWPETSLAPGAPIVVCIFGDDPLNDSLKPMQGRTVNQREITLRQLHDMKETEGCHLLFVGKGAKQSWPKLRSFLSGKSILTVSDFSAFAAGGGMIELGRKDNHISASLNVEAVNAAGLRIEDRLLRLVTVLPPAAKER